MSFVAVVAAAYLALCALMFATQRSQIYFPTPESHHSGAEVLRLQSHGEQIKVWQVRRPDVRALIYFGGNAEDTALNIDAFAVAFPDHSLYLVNYRGYGGSSGRPTEGGLMADALSVYHHVRARHSDVTVMGRSLGSSVAVYLASERPVTRLVLVTPYDSLVNVARHHFRFLPVGTLMRDRYDSASRAPEVRAPVLVVIAADDEIIPRARSEALIAAFPPEQVRTALIAGQGHNTLDLAPGYLGSVVEFLAVAAP